MAVIRNVQRRLNIYINISTDSPGTEFGYWGRVGGWVGRWGCGNSIKCLPPTLTCKQLLITELTQGNIISSIKKIQRGDCTEVTKLQFFFLNHKINQ